MVESVESEYIHEKCEYNGIKFVTEDVNKCKEEDSNIDNIDISSLNSELLKYLLMNKAIKENKSNIFYDLSSFLSSDAARKQINGHNMRIEILILAIAIIFLAISMLIWSFKSQMHIVTQNVNKEFKEENDINIIKKEQTIENMPNFDSSTSSSSSSSQGRILAGRNRKESTDEFKINNFGLTHYDFEINNQDILGMGSLGTTVYSGKFQMREVAVKRLLKNYIQLAKSEIAILMRAEHANVVRYYLYEEDE